LTGKDPLQNIHPGTLSEKHDHSYTAIFCFFTEQDVLLSDGNGFPPPKRTLALKGSCKTSQLVFPMLEYPKRKGRPPKKEDRRAFKIDVRFTAEEYKLIADMALTLGISKTKLVRLRVLHNGRGTIVNAKDLIRELNQIGTGLGRSGNNLNQLAHYANKLNKKRILSPVVAERFILLLEVHIKNRTRLDISLRKIIRILGH